MQNRIKRLAGNPRIYPNWVEKCNLQIGSTISSCCHSFRRQSFLPPVYVWVRQVPTLLPLSRLSAYFNHSFISTITIS
ncbi:hypothetical protein RchiOBHm_Chr1g0346691 [Rosa chinensis]|uniref:Uncharacterized protein n=1 Tax=Rosa chinensis TaxID=74649 RepID=A0A2P6SF54_ROSCH|nr:hypothetical protein RchiOBHm_Chr1g0346691 [Rosa chinensis]